MYVLHIIDSLHVIIIKTASVTRTVWYPVTDLSCIKLKFLLDTRRDD